MNYEDYPEIAGIPTQLGKSNHLPYIVQLASAYIQRAAMNPRSDSIAYEAIQTYKEILRQMKDNL